jgi:protein ImuB
MFAALYAPSVPLAALIDVARAFTPRFEQCGSLVLLDASGLSRLFGSPQELGEHIYAQMSRQGRVAIATTQTSAALLALGRPGLTVVAPGNDAAVLASLSVSVLDTFENLSTFAKATVDKTADKQASSQQAADGGWNHPRHTHQASRAGKPNRLRQGYGGQEGLPPQDGLRLLEILSKWGIRTLGALAALSGPEVHERLGGRGVEWQRRARGEDRRPMVPWVDEVPFETVLELEWPIDGLEPLSFVLARLLEPLSLRLEQADRGAAVICTSLRLTTKAVLTRTLQLPAPMRDPKTLRTLVLLDLESHPPDAAIDTVRVHIEPTPGRVLQWTLLDRAQPAPEQVSTLVARLTALMGQGRVGSPGLVDTWKPGAFEMKEFRVSSEELRTPDSNSKLLTLNSALRRFRLPIPARVQVHEGRPVRLVTDRNGFTSGAIAQAAGPWRTSGEWWTTGSAPSASAAAWDRDEWEIGMNDGTVYRLFVEREVGQWFIEGVID